MTAVTREVGEGPGRLAGFLAMLVGAAILAAAIVATGEQALYGLAGALLFALFLRYPILGLYITTALLLISGSATIVGGLRVSIPLTASKVAGFAAFAAWAINVVVTRKRIRFTAPTAVLLAFLGWSALGVLFSSAYEQQWAEWFRMATLVAYFVLAVNLLDSGPRIRTFVIIVLLCGLAMAAFALAQYVLPSMQVEIDQASADVGARKEVALIEATGGGEAIRVSGGAGHSNWLAMIILMTLPLTAYWFMSARSFVGKGLSLLTVAFGLVALVLTFTRTGFLVGVIILAILGLRNLVRFTPQRVVAVALALFFAWFFLPQSYKERVLNLDQYTKSESVRNRMELQQAAWEMAGEHPLFGVGLGGYGPRLLRSNIHVANIMRWFVEDQDWPPQFIGCHNFYLQVASETGIVGLLLMLAFLALVLREVRRAHREFREAGNQAGMALTSTLEVCIIAFLIAAVFLHALQQKILWMIVALATASSYYQFGGREAPHAKSVPEARS